NTSDYISYIADHTFHGHFKLNCLVETETATAATGRASDSTLDKPPGDERRKILKRVKREFVRDMDADTVLLQMAAEDVFNKTGEEGVKVNQIRLNNNYRGFLCNNLLYCLPKEGEGALIFSASQLANCVTTLAILITVLNSKQADRVRQAPDSSKFLDLLCCLPREEGLIFLVN
ncbi:unnamed protein product, partial [Pocillopora meandrina]